MINKKKFLSIVLYLLLSAGCSGGGSGGSGPTPNLILPTAQFVEDPIPAPSGGSDAPVAEEVQTMTPIATTGLLEIDLRCLDAGGDIAEMLVRVGGTPGYYIFSFTGGGASGTISIAAPLGTVFPLGIVDLTVACRDAGGNVSNHVPVETVVEDTTGDVTLPVIGGSDPPNLSGTRTILITVLDSSDPQLIGQMLTTQWQINQNGTSATITDATGTYPVTVLGRGDSFTLILETPVDLFPIIGIICTFDTLQTLGGTLQAGRISGQGNIVFANVQGSGCAQALLADQFNSFVEQS